MAAEGAEALFEGCGDLWVVLHDGAALAFFQEPRPVHVGDYLALQAALQREEVVGYEEGVVGGEDAGLDERAAVDGVGFEVPDALSQLDGGVPEAEVSQ